jgi:uncharacterized repeat protein (TIGR03803 family)
MAKGRRHFFLYTALTLFLISNLFVTRAWPATEKVVYGFAGGTDGGQPTVGHLIRDAAGNLYGTTPSGGTYGAGTVFELIPGSNGSWTESVIYSLTGGSDGGQPSGGLTLGKDGNLYGTTATGGGYCGPTCGVVFEVRHLKTGWTEFPIYTFQGTDGAYPRGGVIFDSVGNLYGTTSSFGPNGCGTVFELTRKGNIWNENILHSFACAPDGSGPVGDLVFDNDGNIYGATEYGGSGCGVVFELTPGGTGWSETGLYRFDNSGTDGYNPNGSLVLDGTGTLYGTTIAGGTYGNGTVFALAPGWKESLLYEFSGGSDGSEPYSGVIFGQDGGLYGTTSFGGNNGGRGVVFGLHSGSKGWTEDFLYKFCPPDMNYCDDGAFPESALIQDDSGNLYGLTSWGGGNGTNCDEGGCGAVFEVRGPGDPFLSFPLQNRNAFDAKIISVFDHSSNWQYCADNVIEAYDGERGELEYGTDKQPTDPTCYLTGLPNLAYAFAQNDNKTPFSVNGQYVGVNGDGSKKYLQYDGHPGYDFATKDQNKNGQIPVLAAADGTVVCSNVPVPANCTTTTTTDPCIEGPGEIKIRHPNGYFSMYLHLSSSSVTAKEQVSSQQQIGISGDTGVCGNPHLHFEIRRSTCGNAQSCVCNLKQTENVNNCIPVDPYGWWGVGEDPYMHKSKKVENINLWK